MNLLGTDNSERMKSEAKYKGTKNEDAGYVDISVFSRIVNVMHMLSQNSAHVKKENQEIKQTAE